MEKERERERERGGRRRRRRRRRGKNNKLTTRRPLFPPAEMDGCVSISLSSLSFPPITFYLLLSIRSSSSFIPSSVSCGLFLPLPPLHHRSFSSSRRHPCYSLNVLTPPLNVSDGVVEFHVMSMTSCFDSSS